MFRSSLAVLAIGAAFAPSPARADDAFFGLGGHVITSFASEADESAVLSWGAQARLRPFRKIAVEASVGLREEEFHDGLVESKAYPVQASALFFILTGRAEVYALGGATYMIVDVRNSLSGEDDIRNIPGFHLGGGAQVKIYGPWHVHADLRYLFADDDFEGVSIDYDGALVNAGISYWW